MMMVVSEDSKMMKTWLDLLGPQYRKKKKRF